MIICRTPFRISFFGGGTDFPAWYRENDGAVLSTTIDKYCYISCRHLPSFFEHKHKIVYSRTEQVREIDEIIHPAVRETFRFMDVKEGLEIHHDGDLPARTGLGSSSAFTVGLLHALCALRGKEPPKRQLALEAIHIEQEMIKENVGSQDQSAAAFGGFNKISFSGDHNIEVKTIVADRTRLRQFQDHLMLFFTGFSRSASKIEADKLRQLSKKCGELKAMRKLVDEAVNVLSGSGDILDFGRLLNETWRLKKSLSDKVSSTFVDQVYEIAMRNGATGGKILGAGGGGFILLFVRPDCRDRLKQALDFLLHVPFQFDTSGSRIIYQSADGAGT
jgi:D-glycero-alpha-D-manno-heptose-7-phosphate kinase